MNPRDNHRVRHDDSVLASALARGRHAPTDPCPDENALTAFAEGRLLAEERERIEPHVAACNDCLAVVGAIARVHANDVATDARRRGRSPWFTIAAVIVAAVGVAALLRMPSRPTHAESLVASADRLAAARPDLFAGFRPLDDVELATTADTRVRGGTRLHSPAGIVLEPTPRLDWDSSRGNAPRRVEVLREDGTIVLDTTCASPCLWPAAAPPLAEDAPYSWRLTIDGPFGPETTTREFRVASATERAKYEAASAEIRRVVAPTDAELVLAHFALRQGMPSHAYQAALRYTMMRPEDPVGQATLAHAAAELGRE